MLIDDVRACTVCSEYLPCPPRPILQFHPDAKILIAGQAPGKKAHQSGIPFDDASGKRLREWLGLTREEFYNSKNVAILPIGFCYPGTGKSGDLSPRPECSVAWREKLLSQMSMIKMTVVLGEHAQRYHFGPRKKMVTELVKSWREYWPTIVPMPHPSPRNNIWLRKNQWFAEELLPLLKNHVRYLLSNQ